VVFIAPKREVRVNERIRVPQIRVIGPDGKQIGIMPTRDALTLAREQDLDLVEVSPDASPPVCRIMDFGKYKYEQSKRAKKAKKKQHTTQLKELKLGIKIEDHDYAVKLENARRFLRHRDKVKFTVFLRGREMDRSEAAVQLLTRAATELQEEGQIELAPKVEGRTVVMILGPKPIRKGGRPQEQEVGESHAKAEN